MYHFHSPLLKIHRQLSAKVIDMKLYEIGYVIHVQSMYTKVKDDK